MNEVLTGSFLHSIWYTHTAEQIVNGLTKVISPEEWPSMLQQLCINDFEVAKT